MNDNPIAPDREAWLTEAAALLLDDVIMPACTGHDDPPVRLSVGFPTGRPNREIATCYRRAASADGTNEIFVSPTIDDPAQILAALVHELIHAVDDCQSGHRNFFARTARAVGLAGRLTATTPGPELQSTLDEIAGILGPIPHARLDLKERPRDGTRMIKCACASCGFTVRMTRTWITAIVERHGTHRDLDCLACGAAAFTLDV